MLRVLFFIFMGDMDCKVNKIFASVQTPFPQTEQVNADA